MRILFLGTSHGVPEPHRRCSSTLLEVNGARYFIDMGTQVIADLVTRGIHVEDVKAVFVTHMHGDHINGLVEFVDLLSWYYDKANPQIFLPMPEAEQVLTQWLAFGDVERKLCYGEVKSGKIYEDENLTVTAIPTEHTRKSFAFLLEAEGKAILFTGDLRSPLIDFPKLPEDRKLALAVCEGAHFSAAEYASCLGAGKTGRICINHYGMYGMPGIELLKEQMKDIPVFVVHDGMEILI